MEQTPAQAFAANVKAWRAEVGWSQKRLAEEMAARGVPTTREALAKLETGNRQDVTVSEVLAAALALNVAPVDLLLPAHPFARVKVAAALEPWFSASVRSWFVGEEEPDIVDDEPAAKPDFYRHAPTEVQHRGATRNLPAVSALDLLTSATKTALSQRRRPKDAKSLAAAMRQYLTETVRHAELLCEDLEREDIKLSSEDLERKG